MRVWNEWADEHWDTVALALGFTTALAFAAALVLTFNAFATPLEARPTLPALGTVPVAEDMWATLPTDLP